MKTSYSTSDFLSNKTKINDVRLQNMYKNLNIFLKKYIFKKMLEYGIYCYFIY